MVGSAGGGLSILAALIEPIALAVHLEDVDVVREAVEERPGEAFGWWNYGYPCMVSFSFSGVQHPEPTGSWRATPTSTFQHRAGYLLRSRTLNLGR